MAKNLTDCIAQVQGTVSGISGLNDAGHSVVDDLSPMPFVTSQPQRGEFTVGTILRKGLHTIACGVYVPQDDYPRYRAALTAAVESIADALNADPTLTGTCDTITNITYTYGSTTYGAATVWGVTFLIEVKIQ